MKYLIFNINIFFFTFFNITALQQEWTCTFKKKFKDDDTKEFLNKKEISFSKNGIEQFNQLIFCWNIIRPKTGYFTFYVKPRYASSSKYGEWYKMADWGNNIQRSHCTMQTGNTSFVYVRLEMPMEKLADGFILKVVSNDNADFSLIKMLGVCVSNFAKFKNENPKDYFNLPSIKINEVPQKSQMILKDQDCKSMCSPTSTSMLVSYLTKKEHDPLSFAFNVYDNGLGAYGSWPFNTAHAFEMCPDYYFIVTRLKNFAYLHSNLMRGLPVVVSVRGKLDTAPQEYNKGHLILIIGWDQIKKEVLCHDPAFDTNEKVFHQYNLSTFLKAWEKSNRLSYVVEKS